MIQAVDVDKAEPWPDGQIAKKTKRYPSDLTNEEREQFAPLMPQPGRRGRPREVDFREVIDACATWSVRVAAGGCCRSTLDPGRRSMAGFESWRGGFCSRPSTMWR
ncbi:hypothetical protein X757_31855 [Mesorhizobium sp. LSHC414A00]|nr:hypothetical protein X757_31855 [Mesorhizobium sp. LSHC414A00]